MLQSHQFFLPWAKQFVHHHHHHHRHGYLLHHFRAVRTIFGHATLSLCYQPHIYQLVMNFDREIFPHVKGKKLKAICESYSTAALRHIVLLPE